MMLADVNGAMNHKTRNTLKSLGASLALVLATGVPLEAGGGKDHGSHEGKDHHCKSMARAEAGSKSADAHGGEHTSQGRSQTMWQSGESTAKHGKGDSFNAAEASTLVGMKVKDANGKGVGRITDFVVTFGELGRITHAIVGTGILPAIGGTERAVPADALTRSNGAYHLAVTGKEFRQSKPIQGNPEAWTAIAGNLEKVDQHYGLSVQDNGKPHFLYSELEGDDLVDRNGREIGEISDLVVSLKRDLNPYLLVRPTGILRPADQGIRYGIPTTRIHSPEKADRKDLATSLDSQTIRDAQRVGSMEELSTDNTGRGLIFIYEG